MSTEDTARALGAAAGIIGPVLFFTVITIHGSLRPHYSSRVNVMSELTIGPGSWVARLNSIIGGLLRIVFAATLWQSVVDTPSARVGFTLLIVNGIGSIGGGLFPHELRPPRSLKGRVHLFFGLGIVFGMLPLACFALCLAFAADSRWANFASYTFITGLAAALLYIWAWVAFALRSPPGRPPRVGNLYIGLIQRVNLAVFFAWQVVVAMRLWRTDAL